MTGVQALANAIVLQAVKDYRRALMALKRNPRNREAGTEVRKIESFFQSSWYSLLTDLDPDELVEQLRKETVK